ncbi:MAG: ABC transporter ATP-binding protein [Pseudomonadota bacterium]
MARIELKNLTKDWGSAIAVDNIDLSLEEGEFAAILGPSGCGKSTTLFMLAGIYAPTGGNILFDGARVNDVEARDRNVGIVFQSYALYPNMSVLQNILFPLRFKNVDKAEATRQAREIADLVQIGDLLERRPGQLSGGQQQRVALARALIKKPNLLLLDEPLSNLDATLRLTMRSEIRRIQRELGVTTILVTHDQIEATTMADRVICMNKGRIEQEGAHDTLYREPDTLFVASFLGSPPMNLVDGVGNNGQIRVGDLTFVVAAGDAEGEVVCGIRPEQITEASDGIPAEIIAIEPLGREILYKTQTDAGPMHFLHSSPIAQWREGDRLSLAMQAPDTMVFDRANGKRLPGVHFHVT